MNLEEVKKKQIKQKMPIGIIIILILTGGEIIFSLRYALTILPYQWGTFLVSGTGAILIHFIQAGISGIIFYGILKRFNWARKLTIGWNVFTMAITLINPIVNKILYGNYYRREMLTPEATALDPTIITIWLIVVLTASWTIQLIITIYLIRKKEFFVN